MHACHIIILLPLRRRLCITRSSIITYIINKRIYILAIALLHELTYILMSL
jgi:hypothetical protein